MKSPAKKIQMPKVIYENQPLGIKEWGITLGICAVIFILIIGFLPIEAILSKSKYHLTGSRQRDQIVQIYELIENQKAKPFDTILFGTSSSRASIENSDFLETQFRETYGKEMSFVNFSSMMQTFLQTLAFVDRIEFQPHQTVIFNLAASNFARTPTFTTFLFKEAHPIHHFFALKDQLGTVPELTNYIDEQNTRRNLLSNLRNQLYKDINLTLTDWAQRNIYHSYSELYRFFYDGLSNGNEDDIKFVQDEKVAILEEGFDSSYDYNMRLFRIVIEKILKSGAKIHFIEQARMVDDTTYDPWQQKYDELIQELTTDYPITYTDFNDNVDLQPKDFHDITHVWITGRQKWTRHFLKWLDGIKHERQAI